MLRYSYRGDDPSGDFCDCYYNVRAILISGLPVELDADHWDHRDKRIDLFLPQRLLEFRCCMFWLLTAAYEGQAKGKFGHSPCVSAG